MQKPKNNLSAFVKQIEEVNAKQPDVASRAQELSKVWSNIPQNSKEDVLATGLLDDFKTLRSLQGVEPDKEMRLKIEQRVHFVLGDEYAGGPQGISHRAEPAGTVA
ncbi:MAG: hypothetical protein KGH98_00350 [Candidatus Micrarchaeota archaeon]|nr:hypothetical protein [Candidatus Micrarchaeota archaeon]